jgi:azurin
MKACIPLLALALLGAASVAHASPNCAIRLKAGDNMQFDQRSATVSAGCRSITLELEHTGKLPVTAMGHNVVLAATADVDAVARDGLRAGSAAGYLPAGNARVLAATRMLGGGQRASVAFPGSRLRAGGAYTFFCSFPGHSALMRGSVTVVP